MPTQQKIAGILGAYDDLIENNARRIAIVTAMARAIHREWFIRLHLPGHGKTKASGRDRAQLPEGWQRRPVQDLLAGHIGGGWGKDSPDTRHTMPAFVIRGTDIPGARHTDVSQCPFRYHTESNVTPRRLTTGDIILEVSGGGKDQAVGRSVLVTAELLRAFSGDVICASFCKRISPNAAVIHPAILAQHIDEMYDSGRVQEYQVQSTGIKNFKFAVFLEKELVVVPPLKLQERYAEIVEPLIAEVGVLGAKNTTLAKARDYLLSRFMSGDHDVADMDVRGEADGGRN